MSAFLLRLLVAGATMFGISIAEAGVLEPQVRPGLWEVATAAAADSGLDSPIAPIILGNVYATVQKRDPVRLELTHLQLMLAYVGIDRYDLFSKVYGARNLNFDAAKFDPLLKDYIPTVRTLQDSYYNRWKEPRANDTGIRLEALEYGAVNFARLEVALRRQIKADDKLALADTLAERGLAYKKKGDLKPATDDFQEALSLMEAERHGRDAVAYTTRAFTMREQRTKVKEIGEARVEDATEVPSSDEPYLPNIIIQAAVEIAEEAINDGNQSEAQKFIEIMRSAVSQGDSINSFMHSAWPCQYDLGAMHLMWAKFYKTKLEYARKFQAEPSEDSKNDYARADTEFKKALEIVVFSKGGGSTEFENGADVYLEFLKDAGHEDEARQLQEEIKSLSTADVGSNGLEAWRQVLDCRQKSM